MKYRSFSKVEAEVVVAAAVVLLVKVLVVAVMVVVVLVLVVLVVLVSSFNHLYHTRIKSSIFDVYISETYPQLVRHELVDPLGDVSERGVPRESTSRPHTARRRLTC